MRLQNARVRIRNLAQNRRVAERQGRQSGGRICRDRELNRRQLARVPAGSD